MDILQAIFMNAVLRSAVCGWCAAQIIKTVIESIMARKFLYRRLLGDGGMPSAHSTTVMAVVTAVGRTMGFQSPVFGLAAVFAFVTMHDAMGVRRVTGEQSKLLNSLVVKWIQAGFLSNQDYTDRVMKEMVGHTPLQVCTGALCGICVGLLVPM